jgi:small subunit ribosomal protein S7
MVPNVIILEFYSMLSNNPNKLITGFLIQRLLQKGKKSKAEFLFSKLIRLLQFNYRRSSSILLMKALLNTQCVISFKTTKIRGSNFKVPFFLKDKKKITQKWFLMATKIKKLLPTVDFLAKEIMEAFFKQGETLKKRNEIFKLASHNKVFAHFRWF